MANRFVTVSNGLVTRRDNTAGQYPVLTISDDPWIAVSDLIVAPSVGDHTLDGGETFVLDKTALSTAQGDKLAELRNACANHIKNFGVAVGFGPPTGSVIFASKPIDQHNMHSAFEAASGETDPSYVSTMMCGLAPASGLHNAFTATDWGWRDFTKAQILQIASNLHVHIQEAREQLQDLTGQVMAATTVSGVESVEWVELP